jgi:hypothetical protein
VGFRPVGQWSFEPSATGSATGGYRKRNGGSGRHALESAV